MGVRFLDKGKAASTRGVRFLDDKPSSQGLDITKILRAIFTPTEMVRKVVGSQATGALRTLSGAAEQSLPGRAVRGQERFLTSKQSRVPEILKNLIRVSSKFRQDLPEQAGEAIGTAASIPFDPTTALFGISGGIRNRLLRGTAGAATGATGGFGRSLASTDQPDPSSTLFATLMGLTAGGIGSAATRIGPKGVRVAPTTSLSPAEQAKVSAAQQSARTLGAQPGGLAGRRGILGTSVERTRRLQALKEEQLVRRLDRQQEAQTIRQQQLEQRFDRSLTTAREKQGRALDEIRARTNESTRRLSEVQQAESTRLTQQQTAFQQQLDDITFSKVEAVRNTFPEVATKSSQLYRKLVDKGIRRLGRKPVGRQEYLDELRQRFPDDPSQVTELVDQVFGNSPAMRGRQAYGRLQELARQIPRTAHQGKRAYTSKEWIADQALDALVATFEGRGATQFQAARNHWRQWAPLRDRVFKDFQPLLQDPLDLDRMTQSLLKSSQESRPRFIQRLEEVLNIPIFPELRVALQQLDDVQALQVALKIRSSLLKEQTRVTGQRLRSEVVSQFQTRQATLEARQTRVSDLFGQRQTTLRSQHDAQLRQLRQKFEAWSQDQTFRRRFAIEGGIGIAAMLLYWNLVANAVRGVLPDQRFENF